MVNWLVFSMLLDVIVSKVMVGVLEKETFLWFINLRNC